MIIETGIRFYFVWQWPTGGMLWHFWGWAPKVMDGRVTGWRLGPLTLWRSL